MKLFFSEFPANYDKYFFPYQVWLLKEEGDSEDRIYGNGFLPNRYLKNVYYLSRSVRVNLERFDLSSENRRILKKTEGITAELVRLSDFSYLPAVQKFCKNYVDEKLGKGLFSTETIKSIFTNRIFSHVFIFKGGGDVVGYAISVVLDNFVQYGYAFYNLNYLKQNLGARMMLEAVIWAKNNQKKFVYLGTCYHESNLYKTEFSGVEFFNGFKWSGDLNELKKLVGRAGENYLLKDEKFLEEFYQNDIGSILNKFGVRVNF